VLYFPTYCTSSSPGCIMKPSGVRVVDHHYSFSLVHSRTTKLNPELTVHWCWARAIQFLIKMHCINQFVYLLNEAKAVAVLTDENNNWNQQCAWLISRGHWCCNRIVTGLWWCNAISCKGCNKQNIKSLIKRSYYQYTKNVAAAGNLIITAGFLKLIERLLKLNVKVQSRTGIPTE